MELNNLPDHTGAGRFIGNTGLDPADQAELEEATARFLRAACKTWPRLAPEFMAGCIVSITTRAGVGVRLAAGATPPTSNGGIILPGGRR